jgi:hypothetical protein
MPIIIDKFLGGTVLDVTVDVEYSRRFKVRLAVGMLLIRLAVWIMGIGVRFDEEEK